VLTIWIVSYQAEFDFFFAKIIKNNYVEAIIIKG